MISNHTNRKTFIHSIVNLVKLYKIDGVDLDWEFPLGRTQRMHFTQLLEEIRTKINKIPYKFLLTVAVSASQSIIDSSYDIPYMNTFVDFINLMTYDYHFYTIFTPFTGINAPLYKGPNDRWYLANQNINYSINYLLNKGMDRGKIVVGLPTYGHSFKLINNDNNGIYSPAKGYGDLGGLGFVNYNEICKFIQNNKLKPIFDNFTKSPYVTKDDEWISYDDEISLKIKIDFIIRKNNFSGIMIYSLNSDDYNGDCGKGKFPLINSINN